MMAFFVLGSQESRSILRRLDRVIGFPEEGALMLRDFEHALFGGTTVKQLLQGLVKNLAKRKGQHQRRKEQNTVLHFHRIVAHFYLVSSKINQCWYKLQIKLYYWKYWRTNLIRKGLISSVNFLWKLFSSKKCQKCFCFATFEWMAFGYKLNRIEEHWIGFNCKPTFCLVLFAAFKWKKPSFQVTEWVVQLIISKGSQPGRRALLSCVLRLMQASWNIGNFNGVMEILLGLR